MICMIHLGKLQSKLTRFIFSHKFKTFICIHISFLGIAVSQGLIKVFKLEGEYGIYTTYSRGHHTNTKTRNLNRLTFQCIFYLNHFLNITLILPNIFYYIIKS